MYYVQYNKLLVSHAQENQNFLPNTLWSGIINISFDIKMFE
jgi:hypothetical protein